MPDSKYIDEKRYGLGYYDIGSTPFYALQSDTRLSYCLYVPTDYDTKGEITYPLIVLCHGTERWPANYRDNFAAFAQQHSAIVLAPLFPCNLFYVGDTENYKLLKMGDIRFDLALLSMVDEVASRYRLESHKFLLHGFSGGGHFSHRFLYTHPERLLGVSIGAPGVVTLCDPTLEYPLGLKGMDDFLGDKIKPDCIADVPVQCVIGAADTETWEITVEKGDPLFWTPGINETGRTRIDRLRSLAGSLEGAGCKVRFDLVEGVDHDEDGVAPAVQEFFANVLGNRVAP
ncbi:alpha/beta hydrolase [Sulfitobacter sp. F26204]|uniref:alpha/beta hydrolase n=1 Tax=Sulfitobacter sp. F26204 TaxID=2996014 RepID=UPI00225E2224|nr:alpha/beta hydrolase [Sulfitobacter sp. F26204]MCX7561900.1 alpha/beta hydrolase [Sulfitobacter sp. F26204]